MNRRDFVGFAALATLGLSRVGTLIGWPSLGVIGSVELLSATGEVVTSKVFRGNRAVARTCVFDLTRAQVAQCKGSFHLRIRAIGGTLLLEEMRVTLNHPGTLDYQGFEFWNDTSVEGAWCRYPRAFEVPAIGRWFDGDPTNRLPVSFHEWSRRFA